MASHEDIDHQLGLIRLFRDRLRVNKNQFATFGAHVPNWIVQSSQECAAGIATAKAILRDWGAYVSDDPIDSFVIQIAPPPQVTPEPIHLFTEVGDRLWYGRVIRTHADRITIEVIDEISGAVIHITNYANAFWTKQR